MAVRVRVTSAGRSTLRRPVCPEISRSASVPDPRISPPADRPEPASRPFGPRLWWGLALAGLFLCAATAQADTATGKPDISGRPQVGETLTADASSIMDSDGLGTFSYQWVRVDASTTRTHIPGATSSTYTLTTADRLKWVEVIVEFTDGMGNAERLASGVYPSGTNVFGIAGAQTACPADSDWCEEMDVGFRWASPLSYSHGVSFGYGRKYASEDYYGALSDTLVTHGESTYTFLAIQFSAGIGDVDSRFVMVKTDERMPVGTVFDFGGTRFTAVEEAWYSGVYLWGGGAYLFPLPSDFAVAEGTKLTVSVEFPDSDLSAEATGRPSIEGTPRVGETLSVTTADIADSNGKTKAEAGIEGYAYTYQWVQVDGVDEVDISGATDSTYTVDETDEGKKIKVKVSFTDDRDNAEGPLESLATATVEGLDDSSATAQTLTVQVRELPPPSTGHDGETAFTFELEFNQDVTISAEDMRDHALSVTGGTVTAAAMVDARRDLWEITLQPSGTDAVIVSIARFDRCSDAGALCTADRIALTALFVELVPYVAASSTPALTAEFTGVPGEHDGSSIFGLRLVYSEAVFDGSESFNKNRAVRDALSVTGGAITTARRVDPDEYDQWLIRIEPSGNGAVTVTLPAGGDCATAPCTSDGHALSQEVTATIVGPPGLSVADAEVEEGPGAKLAFAITLDRAASNTVTVQASTSDGTAVAGDDYRAKTLTKTFAPGEKAAHSTKVLI